MRACGCRKLSSAQSSCKLFCRGVPVSSSVHARRSLLRETVVAASSFLTRCPSSKTRQCLRAGEGGRSSGGGEHALWRRPKPWRKRARTPCGAPRDAGAERQLERVAHRHLIGGDRHVEGARPRQRLAVQPLRLALVAGVEAHLRGARGDRGIGGQGGRVPG